MNGLEKHLLRPQIQEAKACVAIDFFIKQNSSPPPQEWTLQWTFISRFILRNCKVSFLLQTVKYHTLQQQDFNSTSLCNCSDQL